MALRHPPQELLAAAQKYGHIVDHVAAQYTNPVTGGKLSGAALLLKDALGENGWGNKGVSSAGARGYTQFIRPTRDEYIKKYGIDPWRSADEAIHATAIYFKNAGNIASYNPGMPSYTNYILGQKIGNVLGGPKGRQAARAPVAAAASPGAGNATAGPVAQSGDGLASLLASITGQRSAPPISAPALPSFAARAATPKGYTPIVGATPAVRGLDSSVLAQALSVAQGAVPSASTPTAGGGAAPARVGRTLVVGDSLGVGTSPRLKQLLGGRLDVNAIVGRSSTASVAAARRALASGRYSSVVLDFGTNDSSAAALAQSVKQAAQLAPNTQIFIPTLNGPGAAQKNAVLHRVEAALPNVRLVPWHSQSGGLLGPDGIHATAGGYDRRAQLVATALGVRPPAQPARRALPIGAHGGWGGSEGPAYALYQAFGKPLGLSVTSTKRDNTNPFSGKGSDHDFSQRQSFAIDASNGGAPTPQMDQYAYEVMHALGFKDYRKGTPINASQGIKTINGVRFQVIYRGSGRAFGGNHLTHVHLGVRHVG